jgi:hypothetical protein
VTVTAGGISVFAAAYSSFNPSSLTSNFLGSTGGCGITGSFSFALQANQSFVVVLEECVAGTASSTPFAYVVNASFGVLAATFRSLSVSQTARGALVRWRTASEGSLLGFNVYRAVNGRKVRVNRSLIRAGNTPGGRAYSFLDRRAPRNRIARYWIQAVNVDGSRAWYGPGRAASAR